MRRMSWSSGAGFPRGSLRSSTKFSLKSCSHSSKSCDRFALYFFASSVLFWFSVSVGSCSGFPRSSSLVLPLLSGAGFWVYLLTSNTESCDEDDEAGVGDVEELVGEPGTTNGSPIGVDLNTLWIPDVKTNFPHSFAPISTASKSKIQRSRRPRMLAQVPSWMASLDGLRSICFARQYTFCLSEAPCLAPWLLFFLRWRHGCCGRITCPGIEVASRWSVSVGFRVDCMFLPQLQQICSQDIVVWKNSKISVLFKSAIRSCDSLLNLLIFCVWLKSWRNDSSCWWVLEHLDQTSSLRSRVLYSAVWLQKEALQTFCGPRCCYTRNFSNRLMVPKTTFRLGFVDLVDHIASSILARLVALSELSEPFGRAHPEFSYMPLSQCKLEAVRCRERLHVTVFGKILGLHIALKTQNKVRFQVFLSDAILGLRSHGFTMPLTSSMGSIARKKTACLSWRTQIVFLFWGLSGTNQILLIELTSLRRCGGTR